MGKHKAEIGGFAQTSCFWEGKHPTAYALSRLRPFARRRLNTLRPFLVAMRARNPWVRLRFKLLGWKVLFITKTLVFLELPIELRKDSEKGLKTTP